MSPTATIAAIIVALLVFAWLFQSDTKDPGYEAMMRKQEESRKADQAQKAAMNIAVTDAGVTKDDRPIDFSHPDKGSDPQYIENGGPAVVAAPGSENDPNDPAASATRPSILTPRSVFSSSARLNGTYVGVAYIGDAAIAQGDAPSIAFRRDGTFATRNMAAADVDMEAGTTPLASLDRGSGRYKLYGNTLDLTYTDGLNRHKGAKRTYVVVPVGGSDMLPAAITIQGKVFKLDTSGH